MEKVKLIIQIPCYNEEDTLTSTYIDLPKKISGISEIETLIINDGSSDNTVEIANKIGINHIIDFKYNRGLARTFETGIEHCLKLGADIIVNTDGDNQYNGADIEKLVLPILEGRADVVIGDRDTNNIEHFSWAKKRLQNMGSAFIRKLSHTNARDTVSGFRAYSRAAAKKINIVTDFSYTLENLIQLGHEQFRIESVIIRTNKQLRKSRLFKGIPDFLSRQFFTVVRAYATYKALRLFTVIGILMLLPGLAGFARFLYFFFADGGQGHIQSLVFSTTFIILGFVIIMIGILADLISTNRKLIEKLLEMQKAQQWDRK